MSPNGTYRNKCISLSLRASPTDFLTVECSDEVRESSGGPRFGRLGLVVAWIWVPGDRIANHWRVSEDASWIL